MAKKHDLSFDIIRILACFLVIVNHTNSEVFLNMEPCLTWNLSVAYFYFSKIAVPLFLMISGALLLKKDYSYKDILIHKVGKTVLVLCLFSLYIYVVEENHPFDLRAFFHTIWEKPIITSYWYFYLLIALYLALPFLRKLVLSFKEKDWQYFFVIWFIFSGILPVLTRYEIIPTLTFWFDLQIMSGYVGYLFAGYYISNLNITKQTLMKVIGVAIPVIAALLLMSVASAYYELLKWQQLYLMLDNLYYFPVMIMSVLIFFILHHGLKTITLPKMAETFLKNVASTTFGIYVLHMIYATKLSYVRYDLLYFNNQLVSVILFEIFLFIFCSFAVFGLKKVPGFKQIL